MQFGVRTITHETDEYVEFTKDTSDFNRVFLFSFL